MTILNELLTIKKQADEAEASYINDQLSEIERRFVPKKLASIDTFMNKLETYDDYQSKIISEYRTFRFPNVPYASNDLSELLEDSPVNSFLDAVVTQENLSDIQRELLAAQEKIKEYIASFNDLRSRKNQEIKSTLEQQIKNAQDNLNKETAKIVILQQKEKESFSTSMSYFIEEIQKIDSRLIKQEIADYIKAKKNGTPNDFTEQKLGFKLIGRANVSSQIKPRLIGLLEKKIQNYYQKVDNIYVALEQKLSAAEQTLAKYQQDYQNIPEDDEVAIKDFDEKKQNADASLRHIQSKIAAKQKEVGAFIAQKNEDKQQSVRQQEQDQQLTLIKKNAPTAIGLALGQWSSYISKLPKGSKNSFTEHCQARQQHFLSAEVSPLSEPEYHCISDTYQGARNLTEDEKDKLFKNVYQRIVNIDVSSDNSSLDIDRLSSSGSPTDSARDSSEEVFEIDSDADSIDMIVSNPKPSVSKRSTKKDLAFAGALLVSSTFIGAAGSILGAAIGTLIAPGPGTVLGLAAGAGLSGLTTGSVFGGLFGLFGNRNKKPKEKGYQPLAQDDSQSDHRKKPGK